MIQIFGYIFISLLSASTIIVADYFMPGTFLTKFLDNNFIETFAGLVGFNIAAVIFLLGQLIDFEKKQNNPGLFQRTRSEIKQNSYFLLLTFIASFVLLILRPDMSVADASFAFNKSYFILNGLILTIFGLSLVAIFELLGAVFRLGKSSLGK